MLKSIVFTSVALISTQFSSSAQASVPHDRVCVGSAKIAGQSPVSFVFQWEIERLYDHGGPNDDSHQVSFEAKSCYGDDDGAECVFSQDPSEILAPGDVSRVVPLLLKDAKGEIFFEGKFNFAKAERLTGKIARGPGAPEASKGQLAVATVQLTCVSQPKVNLNPAPTP